MIYVVESSSVGGDNKRNLKKKQHDRAHTNTTARRYYIYTWYMVAAVYLIMTHRRETRDVCPR